MLPRRVRFTDKMQFFVSNFGPVPTCGRGGGCNTREVFWWKRLYLIHFMRVVGPGGQFGLVLTPAIEINLDGGAEQADSKTVLAWGDDPEKVRPSFNGFAIQSW